VDFDAILAAEERRERRVPRPVAIARAVRRGRALWDEEAERRRALVVMEPVARDPVRLEALARRQLVEHAVREALLSRMWEMERSPRTPPPRDRGVLEKIRTLDFLVGVCRVPNPSTRQTLRLYCVPAW
jgi:hypothetical protein